MTSSAGSSTKGVKTTMTGHQNKNGPTSGTVMEGFGGTKERTSVWAGAPHVGMRCIILAGSRVAMAGSSVAEPAAVVALDVVAAAVVANSDVLVSALAGTLSAGMPLGLSSQYSAVMGEPTAIGQ